MIIVLTSYFTFGSDDGAETSGFSETSGEKPSSGHEECG